MTLLEHAQRELELANYFDGDMNEMMANSVLELIKVFAAQGHSGFSAPFCVRLFSDLASYKPMGPLTGEDNEWSEVSDGLWQNKRYSCIFKENGKAYNVEGKVFREPNGCCYTNRNSRVDITFPYTVKDPEYVNVPEEVN